MLIFVTNYHALDTCSVEYFADFLRRQVHFVVDRRSYSAHYPPDALVADALELATGYLSGRWKYIAVL